MGGVAASATISVAFCADGASARGGFCIIFFYGLRAAGCAASKALWMGTVAQLLAGNGNGLVQLGLQGFARGREGEVAGAWL